MNHPLQRGFTLIEIMLALFIFAIMAVITSTALFAIFNARDTTNKVAQRLSDRQLAFNVIQRDITQTINRSVRVQETIEKSFYGDQQTVTLTRGGYNNPLANNRRSHLQRVRYQFTQHQLYRAMWQRLDRITAEPPIRRPILSDIKQLQFTYLDHNNQWQSHWPQAGSPPLPRAIQIRATLPEGDLQWVLRIPAGMTR